MRLTADKLMEYSKELLERAVAEGLKGLDTQLAENLRNNPQKTSQEIEQQRTWVGELKQSLSGSKAELAQEIVSTADNLIRRSVWALGGDGWAYDIGFGGLDHVIASGRNINILVMDTEVYSNTGGQMSKATPTGAIAKFAYNGKSIQKKDLGMMAMSYGYVYVARISMGYNRIQTLKAFQEAEAYDGPSIIIAYAPCIAHGIDMSKSLQHGKAIVTSGMWPLFRYNPELADQGKNPLQLDSKAPSTDVEDFMYSEIRFRSLKSSEPELAARYLDATRRHVKDQFATYQYLAERPFNGESEG